MTRSALKKSRLLGSFQLPGNVEVFGELRLRGRETVLRLRHTDFFLPLNGQTTIYGQLHDLSKVSCIQCVLNSTSSASKNEDGEYHSADVFPHFVAIGREHLYPDQPSISAVHFTVDDISSIFYDFDAFGHVIDPTPLIESVVAANKVGRTIPIGDMPQIAYFTGKREVISAETALGKVSVNHRPSWSMGGPNGVNIKNRMMVSIEPVAPIMFEDCIDRVLAVGRFLSLAAGRKQGIKSVHIELASDSKQPQEPVRLRWSFAPRRNQRKGEDSSRRPHPGDVPLNAIDRPQEFGSVLRDWIERDARWRLARVRYTGCLAKGNFYDPDRLVAAANMFDILPDEAVPVAKELPQDLAATQRECLSILRRHPPSFERDSAISNLTRISRPSLPKKVLHRTQIVQQHFAMRLPELEVVATTAVRCRNYFVHGPSGDFDFNAVEKLTSFLTNTLEFIFAASDLIEAGWNASAWNKEGHGWGHSFARYRDEYEAGLRSLKSSLKK